MRRLAIVAAGVVLSAGGALGQSPQPVSVQQQFEAATDFTRQEKNAEALAAWEALERRVARNPRTLAIVRVRKAIPLLRLARLDEAGAAIRAGLSALPAEDASLTGDRIEALIALAAIERQALDYAGALGHYRAALAIATEPGDVLSALIGEVGVGTFVDPDSVLPAAARLEQAMANAKVTDESRASAKIAVSELYLNLGRYEDARIAAREAVKLLGGLTLRANLADVAARSDVAIAALRLGKREEAREYLAYTGAGRSAKGEFRPAAQMVPPDCGDDSGLSPDDVGVVEFSVGADGTVIDSAPVYSSRKGASGLAFARAARQWSWTPEALKDLPAFFRLRTRIEMRCSTAFARPQLKDYLHDALAAWLADKGVPLADDTATPAARLPRDRRALTAAEGKGGGLSLVPHLIALAENPGVPREETAVLARRALETAEAERAPPVARLAIERMVWASASDGGPQSRGYRERLTRAMAAAPYADAPEARNAIALQLAEALGRRDPAQVRTLLTRVGDDPALPAAHPLKVGALVRLASLEQSSENVAAAQMAFKKSGLSAEQCALLDSEPKMRSINANFPQEAIFWGFEGWTRVQLDIDSEGRPVRPRVVAAYPPFVFSPAATNALASARYTKSFRPDGGLGCGGQLQGVSFKLGG